MGYYFHKTLNKSIIMCVDEVVNLQRGYKILIIGGGALVVGIILTMVIFLTFKQTSFNINTGIDTVSPHKSIFKTSEVNRGEKMAIGISSQPSDIPMNLQIIERLSLSKILDVNFTGSSFNQPKIFLGAAALSGVFLSFAGVVILIAGGIILFIDRRRAKIMKT